MRSPALCDPVRHRVPFIPQMEAVECGAASLAMVMAYHGHHAPLSEVRQACGVSRDGATARNIVVAARTYGLVPSARRLEPADLAAFDGPAILHWEMNHFVVLERWTPERVVILDPAEGRRIVTPESFDGSFTGIAIEFSRGASFAPRPKERVSRARYLGLLSGAGHALAMVVVASLALDLLAVVIPLATQLAIDDVIGRHRVDWLSLVGVSAAALVTFSAAWSLLRAQLAVRIRGRLDLSMTQQFVAHLLDLPVPFFAQRTVADLMSRVQSNKSIRDVLAGQSITLLSDGAMLLAYLGLIFAYDVGLTLIVLAAAASYVAIFLLARPSLQARTDDAQRKDVRATSALLQILRGMSTLKSAGVERASRVQWRNAWIASLNAGGEVAERQQTVTATLSMVQLLVPIAVLLVGGRRVLAGALTPGHLVGFQMLAAGFLLPLQGVIETLLRLQIVPVLFGRMDDVLQSAPEASGGTKAPRLSGAITLEGVSFRYSPTAQPVLSSISMHIEAGTKVALVGPSGSGKSTLARLLLGLYPASEGRILLDGHDLADLDAASVRRQIGVVLQETALFEGTVADNLGIFYPHAPREQLVHAARVAQIHDDILALPRGYDTRISSGGGALSGGQRQRLALARAIVHRPPVMILDEATSALDSVTESAIEKYLSTRACTRIVIAHRMSTVRDADTIFVLSGGEIVDRGRHDELLARGGLYARLLRDEPARRASIPPPSGRSRASGADVARFDLFRQWTDDERDALATHLEWVAFPGGARIVEQDARGTGLYLLERGTVSIELSEPGLAPWKITDLQKGAVFGEIGLLDGSPASASVVAGSDVHLLHLSYAAFRDLLDRGDVLAVRAVLSLGAIVADRTRDAVHRLSETASASKGTGTTWASRAEPEAPGRPPASLEDTLLGASLDTDEARSLEAHGRRIVVPRGATLFAEGTPSDTLYVMLSGRVALRRESTGVLAYVTQGALLAEASVFSPLPHVTTAVAETDVVALGFERDALVDLLLSGRRMAPRLLSAVTDALTRRFRLFNFRLREAVALGQGELDRAHAAREQALEAAREEREALMVTSAGRVPVVRARDAGSSAAACLVALVRAAGRPIALSTLEEAFAVVGSDPVAALVRVARVHGLDLRKLEVPLDALRGLERPLLAVLRDGRVVVLERYRRSRWHAMDPLSGACVRAHAKLRDEYSGLAFEVRSESERSGAGSLGARLEALARDRSGDILRIVGATVLVLAFTAAASLATALAVGRVFPYFDRPLLSAILVAGTAVVVALALTQKLQARAILHLRSHFDRELLDQLMTHLLRLPLAFFDRFPAGEVMQRFQAFDGLRQLLEVHGATVVVGVASVGVSGVILLGIDPRLSLVSLLVLCLYTMITLPLFSVTRRAAADGQRARGAQQDRLLEILQGIVTLRMVGDRNAAQQHWLPSFKDELNADLRQDRVQATALPLLHWIRGLALVGTVWLGAHGVLPGSMSTGALVAFLSVLVTFLTATHSLAVVVLSSAPLLADYGLVRATFLEPPETSSATLVAPGQLHGQVQVEGVSFRYSEAGPLVLRDVAVEISPGTKVALVGASGSGKSTLGRLLLGLYLPTTGRILFDGKDVTSLDLEALRRSVGVVQQEPFLLSGSIRSNIALGGTEASYDDVVDAATRAGIHEDIEKMPMRYETMVGEGGSTFSGGQRQRIVIARALVSSPGILLFDEATSALDNISQAMVERHLASSRATRIVIAHRLSTVADADKIVVLDKGRVVEQGTHGDLLAARGAYFDLVRAELREGEAP